MIGRPALPCFLLLTLLAPAPAHADEGEWVIGLEPQLGLFRGIEREAPIRAGVGAQLSAWIGLTDSSWLFAAGGAERSLEDGPTIVEGIFGAVAALDVLRTIPFVELGAGANVIDGFVSPLLRLGLGADYLITPAFSAGAVVRYRPFFGREGESWVTVHLRLALRGEL